MMQGIVGGFAKGMKLQVPKGESTRPTSSKVRQAVLSAVYHWIPAGNILDLFAGSGAMGLEFLSRGAESCTFVEVNGHALQCIRANLEAMKRRADQADHHIATNVIGRAVEDSAGDIKKAAPFDVIWADAPYRLISGSVSEWARTWRDWLAADGLVVVECAVADIEAVNRAFSGMGWSCYRERTYGQTAISMWRMET